MMNLPLADCRTSADKICFATLHNLPPFKLRIADTEADYLQAYGLVYREYLKRGYCPPCESGLRFVESCFLPESKLFILEEHSRICGALSLLEDASGHLPIEHTFAGEVSNLRGEGRRLAELSLFAIDPSTFDMHDKGLAIYQKFRHAFILFKSMFDYARGAGISDLVIAVHPKQRRLYRALSFRQIGETRPYKDAENNPALPLHLDLAEFVRNPEKTPMRDFFLNVVL